jgi:hypothetical protein
VTLITSSYLVGCTIITDEVDLRLYRGADVPYSIPRDAGLMHDLAPTDHFGLYECLQLVERSPADRALP